MAKAVERLLRQSSAPISPTPCMHRVDSGGGCNKRLLVTVKAVERNGGHRVSTSSGSSADPEAALPWPAQHPGATLQTYNWSDSLLLPSVLYTVCIIWKQQ